MDRRNFLQKLGIGGAAVAATAIGTEKAIAKKTKKKTKNIPNLSEADIKYIKKRILEDAIDIDSDEPSNKLKDIRKKKKIFTPTEGRWDRGGSGRSDL